jgi:D-amino peptidase
MYRRVLLLLDLEGVNHVKGEPYLGLTKGSEQWCVAVEQALLEVNAAADALFAAGVQTVGLWDNHGGGGNIDPSRLDPRITFCVPDKGAPRLSFARGVYDCICFFGYHAMEGTLGAVLAHTISSKTVQHYKLNGSHIGEVDLHAYIAAELDISCVFFAAGNVACAQATRSLPHIVTVTTKYEISRNEAEFRQNEDLLDEIRTKVVEAIHQQVTPKKLSYPVKMEKSFKRTEDAAAYLARVLKHGISAEHPVDDVLGRDAHTVLATVNSFLEFDRCI